MVTVCMEDICFIGRLIYPELPKPLINVQFIMKVIMSSLFNVS